MKTKNLILFLFLIIGVNSFSQERLKNRETKSLQILHNMQWYKRLEKNRYNIEGDPTTKTGAIYSYLEHVKRNPGCVNFEQFAQSKARYATIVNEYNQIIDYMIRDVNNITEVPVGELKIDISSYSEQYKKLEKEIPKFVVDLEKELVESEGDCHRAAAVIPVETIVEYIIIPVIDILKKRKLEQYRVIIVLELEKLKLDPSSTWDEIENYLKTPSGYINMAQETIENVYHLAELDYCKLLHIPMKSCYERAEILKQFEDQTADIRQVLSTLTANDKNELAYYNELLAAYTEAKNALLSKCQTENSSQDAEAFKERVRTLMLINDGCVPEADLEKILK
jgi:hypothetical protein